jgi:NTP pyrophosphatase (non-canonical NTP hydrolase)
MTLNELLTVSHNISRMHGFWDDVDEPSMASRKLACLAYSNLELAQEAEAIRNGTDEGNYPIDGMQQHYTTEQIYLLSKLVLAQTEIAEAMEAVMSNAITLGNLPEELSDVFIRLGDLCKYVEENYNCSMDQSITHKHIKNLSRPRRHGKQA